MSLMYSSKMEMMVDDKHWQAATVFRQWPQLGLAETFDLRELHFPCTILAACTHCLSLSLLYSSAGLLAT